MQKMASVTCVSKPAPMMSSGPLFSLVCDLNVMKKPETVAHCRTRVSFAVQFCEPFFLAYLSPRNNGNKRKGEHTFGNTNSTLSASSLCLL